ncbi:hypothetical protein ACFYO7_07410 [Nocardia salmonicida]|uniref:hypothetical protein n=1 Tax=Nocardia salmonicida TaxID=53431 RepID=UPI0036819776
MSKKKNTTTTPPVPAAPAPETGSGRPVVPVLRKPAPRALWAALGTDPGSTTADLANTAGIGVSTARRLLMDWESARAVRSHADPASPRAAKIWTTAGSADPVTAATEPATPEPGITESAAPEPISLDSAVPAEDAGNPDSDASGDPGPNTAPEAAVAATTGDEPADPAPATPAPADDAAMTGAESESATPELDAPAPVSNEPAGPEPADATDEQETHDDTHTDAPGPDTTPPDTAVAAPATDEPADPAPVTPAPDDAPAADEQESVVRLPAGALRGQVEDFLRDHPDEEYSPHQIGKALDRSSGAVHNALVKLAKDGTARQTSTAPKKFALAEG